MPVFLAVAFVVALATGYTWGRIDQHRAQVRQRAKWLDRMKSHIKAGRVYIPREPPEIPSPTERMN